MKQRLVDWTRIAAVALCLLSSVSLASEARIVQLKHRTANDVIPLIRPLLGPDDALTGLDYRLILRTSDANWKQIERVLEQVDVARRQLRITVVQGVAEERDNQSQSVQGQVRLGTSGQIRLPSGKSSGDGLEIQKDQLHYSTQSRTSTSNNAHTQTVLTQDGQRTFIRIGQSVPHVQKILSLGRRPHVYTEGVTYQDVTTGFDVLPRVRGNRVLVEITPRVSSLRNPATGLADFQEFSTTVETQFGEWLDLGSILQNQNEAHRAILESASSTSNERRTVRIRID